MLAGRKILYVIAAMALFVFATKAVPWVFAKFQSGPVFYTTDLRNASFLPPYTDQYRGISDHGEVVKVHGSAATSIYRTPNRRNGENSFYFIPDTTIVADATETVTLPGGTLSILALQLIRRPLPDDPVRQLNPEDVLLHPSGDRMTEAEAGEIIDKIGRELLSIQGTYDDQSLPWQLGVILDWDQTQAEIGRVEFRDSITGGISAGEDPKIVHTWYFDRQPRLFPRAWVGVRPTRMNLHVIVEPQPETTIDLLPIAPRSYNWEGEEFKLTAVTYYSGKARQEQVLSGEIQSQDSQPAFGPGILRLYFDDAPNEKMMVSVFRKDGEEIIGESEYEPAVRYSFEMEDPESIDFIRIYIWPPDIEVVFSLPTLPVIPEPNKDTTTLNEMIIPTTVLNNHRQLERLLSSILQVEIKQTPLPSSPQITYPLVLEDKTVQDLLNLWRGEYGEHELVLRSPVDNGIRTMYAQPPGTERAKCNPVLHKVLTKTADTWHIVFVLCLMLLTIKGWYVLRAYDLKRTLRDRGFKMLGFWDSERLYMALGRKAWRIPSYDELAAIPGVDPAEPASLVRLMKPNS